jgi:hypothetical protein
MQVLSFVVRPSNNRWVLSVGRTVLGNHPTSERALRAAFDMSRRTGGNNRVFLADEAGVMIPQEREQVRRSA